MSDLTNVFTDIADAIRAKTETQITYKPTEMADAINNISSGGGGVFEVTNGTVVNSFNMPVNFPEGITNLMGCFNGCRTFNQPVVIPNSVTFVNRCFALCNAFNQPIDFPSSVLYADNCFLGCTNFNQPVNLANIVYANNLFTDCENFNQPVRFPRTLVAHNCFRQCINFNQPIILDSIVLLSSFLLNCVMFNQPLNFPYNTEDIRNCFTGCYSLNQPISIPDTVVYMSGCFKQCWHFNQPVIVPANVSDLTETFMDCEDFNSPVLIAENVFNAVNVFSNCANFNQPISPVNIINWSSAFNYCYNFNQPLFLKPDTTANLQNMLRNCTNFGSNLYIIDTNITAGNVKNMFTGSNNDLAKHIFCTNALTFKGTTRVNNSIIGNSISWTQDGDNFYNTAYNIYIHNVANPYTVLNNASYNFSSSSPIPDSPAIVFGSGVRDLNYAFYFWIETPLNNNTLILFEEGVENLKGCFLEQWLFNQPVTIPSSAKDCSEMFVTCENLNSDIVFRNGVENVVYAISNCQNFGANIWLPESITNMRYMLNDVPYASGTVHISHNIALGNTDNYIYNSLVNGYIGITLDPSRILNDY